MSLTLNHQDDSISASSGVVNLGSNTGGLVLPNGTSAPAAGNAGALRYNAGALQISNGTIWTSFSGGVTGPISSTNNTIPTWNGTGGNTLQNTPVGLDSYGNLTGVNSIAIAGTATAAVLNVGTTFVFTQNATNTNSTYGSFSAQLLAPTLGTADSSINVATTAFVQSVLGQAVPPGVGPIPYAGGTAPTGWLMCYGQAVSRTTYANLFNTITTTYGAGDGSTTFNVPDMRGRVAAGIDNMGGSVAGRLTTTTINNPYSLGGVGGSETITLTTAQLPSHTHTVNDPGHHHSLGMSNPYGAYANSGVSGGGTSNTSTATTGITINATGGGAAVANVQPTIMMNYIIKY